MTLLSDGWKALRLTAALWLLTVVLYTLPLLAVGQGPLNGPANGSLLKGADGRVVGSALIGQSFSADRYFRSRPSAADYSTGMEAPASGPSNLAATNPALKERIEAAHAALGKAGIAAPAADLLYASGSGLDPHISPQAAEQQITRLAEVRGVSPERLRQLVRRHTDRRWLGLLGEPGVNVLQLNIALDALAPQPGGP
jgi:K+-transporting ATPase ATPase C chain